MKTAIYYASSTGNTEMVANRISEELGGVDIFDISNHGFENIEKYNNLIFGISTWGEGELQDDWKDLLDEFKSLDLKNKQIALFGLGDQESYSEEFVNGMGTIYEILKDKDIKTIAWTSSSEYEHDSSTAEIDNQFVGLVIDEDNESDLTEQRVVNWCNEIKMHFN